MSKMAVEIVCCEMGAVVSNTDSSMIMSRVYFNWEEGDLERCRR
jgi:uncharacterized protein YfcZ (UPF0381/DUF406 family)